MVSPYEKKCLNFKYILNFFITCAWNISHSKKNWARYDKKCILVFKPKHKSFLSDLNESWIFATDFKKILKYQNAQKSIQWKPHCSMRTDRQTDMTKITVAFRSFIHAPKIYASCPETVRIYILCTDLKKKIMILLYTILTYWFL